MGRHCHPTGEADDDAVERGRKRGDGGGAKSARSVALRSGHTHPMRSQLKYDMWPKMKTRGCAS